MTWSLNNLIQTAPETHVMFLNAFSNNWHNTYLDFYFSTASHCFANTIGSNFSSITFFSITSPLLFNMQSYS